MILKSGIKCLIKMLPDLFPIPCDVKKKYLVKEKKADEAFHLAAIFIQYIEGHRKVI